MRRRDAEVAADVGDNSAHRAVTERGGDLLCRRDEGEPGRSPAGAFYGWLGGAPRAIGRSAVESGRCNCPFRAADEPGFERVGQKQAAGDASEDQRDVAGAEIACDGEQVCGGGALLQGVGEVLALVDELAEEAEQAAGPAGCRRVGGGRIQGRIGAVG